MRFKYSGKIANCALVAICLAAPLAGQIPLNPLASRALGHARLQLSTAAPNLVEGRELNAPRSVAVDSVGGYVYVADTGNNRVLGWRKSSLSAENGGAADIILGQRDKYSTFQQGPGNPFQSGLTAPTGLAVDSQGNLYVLDGGNSRIVRYPTPFANNDSIVDMVIGQPNFSVRGNNTGGLSERTLAFLTGNNVLSGAIAFDSQGNLWVTDSGNNRILRYPASALGSGASNIAANLVLGQADFRTNTGLSRTTSTQERIKKTGLYQPSGIAFDQGGRLFVVDGINRALVYRPPFVNGQAADRVLGIVTPPAQGQPTPAPINGQSIGVATSNGPVPAEGVFTIGNNVFILDAPAHRVLRFDPFDSWAAETSTAVSPAAAAIIGQDAIEQTELRINRGLAEPTAFSFANPTAGTFAGGETYIADTTNNRVLVMDDISTGPRLDAGGRYVGKRVIGQIGFEFRSPNLIDGREFQFQNAGLVIDNNSNPPRLYVADTGNHRILGFADARTVRQGSRADIVIGQPDFYRALINYPSNATDQRNDSGLYTPSGLALDREGNLWVADTGNARVLRFPSPFDQRQTPMRADLVLGQASFTARQTDASARTMAAPFGITFTNDGRLLVGDAVLHRVLVFEPPFVSGMNAARAIGQPDLISSSPGNDLNRFNEPRHLAVDTDDRLYVTDFNNNRVLIFSRLSLGQNDSRAAFSLSRGVNRPVAIFVSAVTGEIWVGNAGANQALRYPKFDTLTIGGDQSDYNIPASAPLAIALDASGNLYMAEQVNRVAIYYPTVAILNAANYLVRLTPGMWAALCPDTLQNCVNRATTNRAYRFTEGQTIAQSNPLPKTLGDLAITFNGIAAPIFFTSPSQINFIIPMNLPTNSPVEVEISQASTGRVIAATIVQLDVASPAFFTANASGTGQIAAVNVETGTINNSQNPVRPGQIIALYGTGYGIVPGAPPDGEAVTSLINVPGFPNQPQVILNGQFLQPSDVLFSGLAPQAAGLWQLNVRVPTQTPPGDVLVILRFNDIVSNNPQNPGQIRTTINVR
ncbi:MAG: hypothetical protein IT168_27690 [Bryobacterales bacterium]|nr:hypothetical protein [Bryobacterales bacterium]